MTAKLCETATKLAHVLPIMVAYVEQRESGRSGMSPCDPVADGSSEGMTGGQHRTETNPLVLRSSARAGHFAQLRGHWAIFASILVEDELRDAGATVLGPAPSLGDALRLVEAAAADGGISAAVLDINLDGRHVAPAADRLAALGVPFVFATGYGENHDTGGHGTAPTLPKPFGPERLIAAVERLLATHRGRGPTEPSASAPRPCSRPVPWSGSSCSFHGRAPEVAAPEALL